MIDLHTHLLYDTDDGCASIEDSIEKIKQAKKAGFTGICFTPHYLEPDFENDIKQNTEKINEIKEILKNQNIQMDLFLGNEIFIFGDLLKNLKDQKISTLGNSNYLLIELPINIEIKKLDKILERINSKGLKVIIAHPERYLYVQKNIKYFDKIIENQEVYLQSNYGSFIGMYNKKTKKTVKKLLKSRRISILASDVHNNDIYNEIPNILNKISKLSNKEYINEIVNINTKKVIKNENLNKVNIKKFLLFKK